MVRQTYVKEECMPGPVDIPVEYNGHLMTKAEWQRFTTKTVKERALQLYRSSEFHKFAVKQSDVSAQRFFFVH